MANDDLTNRADDYEERLRRAGNTDDIVNGLVRDAHRNKLVIRALVISILFDLLLSLTLAWVAYRLDSAIEQACVRTAKNSVVINASLKSRIEEAKVDKKLTQAERDEKIKNFEQFIINIPDCYNNDVPKFKIEVG